MALAGPAWAQTTDQAAGDTEEEMVLEEVIVTGSRLRRDSYTVSTPLVMMESQAIQDTGIGSLTEILVDEIPAIFEGTNNTNSQSLVNATGITTMNLRNQGNDRTLVLIDGRRTVPNQYSSNGVSLNSVPTPFVKRVEIITGGSSAAYGSDAIAGVVNIITQDDYVGLGFEGRYGGYTDGGGEEVTAVAQYGTFFADERGYLFFGAVFNDEKGIAPYERDRHLIEAYYIYDDDEMCNAVLTEDPARYLCIRDVPDKSDWRNRSDGIAGGVFEERSSGRAGYWYDENGLRDDWWEETYGIHTQQFVQLKVPEDRYSVAFKTSYEFDNDMKATFSIQYADMNSFNHKSPEDEYESGEVVVNDPDTLLPTGTIRPGSIDPDNPFVPEEIREIAGSSVSWDRRMFEVGNITTDNNRTTLRSLFILQGEFADDWYWDASVSYGKTHQKQLRSNEIDVRKERQALDAEYAEDGVTIQCADPDARAAGCVPLNIFGVGSITPEMANWIRVNPTIDSQIEQTQALFYVSGDLFEMPAGSVPAVFGIEYRKDAVDVKTDEGSQLGGITFNVIPTWDADYNVWEGFTEMAFPLTDKLDLEVSARVADYSPSGIDLIFSYTAGLIWEPVEGYRLRGNYARAQRAPTLAELYSPPRGDYDSINDICDGVTATSDDPGHANCRLEPGIAAVIAAEGEFEDDNNGYGPAAGNPDVFEETADTWTLGISINPSWAQNLRLAVDYWNISIDDKITEYQNSEILKQCYDSSQPWGDSNPFCNEISRHEDDGQIFQILNRQYNLDSGNTEGIDVAMNYVWDFNSGANLTFNLDWTHMMEDSETYVGLDGKVKIDYTGQVAYKNFDDRARASLIWQYEGWRLRWTTKYTSSAIDAKDRMEEWEGFMEDNDERCANGDDDCITNPEPLDYYKFPSYWTHDLTASYTMRTKWADMLRLYAGVRNIFNDKGPFIPTSGDTYASGPGNFDSPYGGGVGRFIFAGIEVGFE
jgi:outer membrane receptor protein involved in Fe transport